MLQTWVRWLPTVASPQPPSSWCLLLVVSRHACCVAAEDATSPVPPALADLATANGAGRYTWLWDAIAGDASDPPEPMSM